MTRTKTVAIGYPHSATRLNVETPQGLIYIATDHVLDPGGRPVLYVSVTGSQFAGEMPYVLVTGKGPGQQGLEFNASLNANQRQGMALRFIQADHTHAHPATGALLWEGLHEECPFCRAYGGDDKAQAPRASQMIAPLRHLPIGTTFRPLLATVGLEAGATYVVVSHERGRGYRGNLSIFGQTTYQQVSANNANNANNANSTNGSAAAFNAQEVLEQTQDTLHVEVVALPTVDPDDAPEQPWQQCALCWQPASHVGATPAENRCDTHAGQPLPVGDA